jgi:DNA-directed RNA polymerase subunit RPC12/RpoP
MTLDQKADELHYCLDCPDPIRMKYDKDKDFWRCPRCGGEWWPKATEISRTVPEELQWVFAELSVQCWPPIPYQIKSGGSKKAGRKRDSKN